MNNLMFSLGQIQKFLETQPEIQWPRPGNTKVKLEDGLSSQRLSSV